MTYLCVQMLQDDQRTGLQGRRRRISPAVTDWYGFISPSVADGSSSLLHYPPPYTHTQIQQITDFISRLICCGNNDSNISFSLVSLFLFLKVCSEHRAWVSHTGGVLPGLEAGAVQATTFWSSECSEQEEFSLPCDQIGVALPPPHGFPARIIQGSLFVKFSLNL